MNDSVPARVRVSARTVRSARTVMARLHTRIYRWSGGRVGSRFGSLEQILLTTTGRRSGQPRTTPLAAFPDGERLLLVASNWGQERDPAWLHNLIDDPRVIVRRGPRTVTMRARVAADTERERLWPAVVAANPGYEVYARRAARTIPVVICEPDPGAAI
jgi:deazaflavin-dependent oxidoreductase (nitroreductase family)